MLINCQISIIAIGNLSRYLKMRCSICLQSTNPFERIKSSKSESFMLLNSRNKNLKFVSWGSTWANALIVSKDAQVLSNVKERWIGFVQLGIVCKKPWKPWTGFVPSKYDSHPVLKENLKDNDFRVFEIFPFFSFFLLLSSAGAVEEGSEWEKQTWNLISSISLNEFWNGAAIKCRFFERSFDHPTWRWSVFRE